MNYNLKERFFMFFSGPTNLKFSKKRNQWENSTESCRVLCNENEKDVVKGYSYREVIFYYDDSLKSWVFNNHGYSVTTFSHQSALRSFLKDDYIIVHADTINDGLKFENLDLDYSNSELVKR